MLGDEILLLGIGIQPAWQLVDQQLDTLTQPHELHLGWRASAMAATRVHTMRPITVPAVNEVRWRQVLH